MKEVFSNAVPQFLGKKASPHKRTSNISGPPRSAGRPVQFSTAVSKKPSITALRVSNKTACACHDTRSNRLGMTREPHKTASQRATAMAAQMNPCKKKGLRPKDKMGMSFEFNTRVPLMVLCLRLFGKQRLYLADDLPLVSCFAFAVTAGNRSLGMIRAPTLPPHPIIDT